MCNHGDFSTSSKICPKNKLTAILKKEPKPFIGIHVKFEFVMKKVVNSSKICWSDEQIVNLGIWIQVKDGLHIKLRVNCNYPTKEHL